MGRGRSGLRNGARSAITTADEAIDMLMDMSDEDFKKQTRVRGHRYFGTDFGRDLNGYLEGNSDLSTDEMRPDYGGAVEDLDGAMVALPRSVTAERYVDERTLPGLSTSNPEALVGKTIHTSGYLSTTLDAHGTDFEFENYPARVVITAPKGTKAILGANPREAEVLFHRDSRYRITSYEMGKAPNGEDQIIYYAKLG